MVQNAPTMTVEQSKEYNEGVLSSFLQALQINDDTQKLQYLEKFHHETDFEKAFLLEKGVAKHVLNEIQHCAKEKKTGVLSKYLDFTADLAKSEAVRKPLGDLGFIEKVAESLETDDLSVKCAALRSVANLSAETQENKDKFTNIGVTAKILDYIKNPQPTILKFAAGALVNLSQDSEGIQKLALENGTMQDLISSLKNEDPEVLRMVSFGILNLIDTEEGLELFKKLNGINQITILFQSQNERIKIMAVEAIRVLSEDDRVKRLLYEGNCVPLLLEAVASNMKVEARRKAAKAVAGLLTNDENMHSLFSEGKLEGFKGWLQDSDDEIRAYAALCIGNLARKDEYCIKMVQNGLTNSLVHLLGNGNSKEQQGAMSALRNLSLAPVNKTIVGKSGLIEELDKILSGDNLHTKFSAVTILKILVTGNSENSVKLLELDTYKKVVDLIEGSAQEAIKCESARVYVQAARNGVESVLNHLAQNRINDVLEVLLQSKHDILKEEGIELASNLLTSDENRKLISEAVGENAVKFLEASPVIQVKALNYFSKLSQGEKSKDIYLTEDVKNHIEKLKSSTNEDVKNTATKLF